MIGLAEIKALSDHPEDYTPKELRINEGEISKKREIAPEYFDSRVCCHEGTSNN